MRASEPAPRWEPRAPVVAPAWGRPSEPPGQTSARAQERPSAPPGPPSARVPAQELRGQPSPLTAWLDLRPAPRGAPPQTTPSWIESFDFIPAQPGAAKPSTMAVNPAIESGVGRGVDRNRSVFRIRLQQPAAATVNELQVRVFFDDTEGSGPQPFVSVWNELGTELLRSNPLGQGLGLPSSETLTVPMAGVDYLEISAAGDGTQVRGVFLSWLEHEAVR